jgi:hypothetical protein
VQSESRIVIFLDPAASDTAVVLGDWYRLCDEDMMPPPVLVSELPVLRELFLDPEVLGEAIFAVVVLLPPSAVVVVVVVVVVLVLVLLLVLLLLLPLPLLFTSTCIAAPDLRRLVLLAILHSALLSEVLLVLVLLAEVLVRYVSLNSASTSIWPSVESLVESLVEALVVFLLFLWFPLPCSLSLFSRSKSKYFWPPMDFWKYFTQLT